MSLHQIIAWIGDTEARILRVDAGIHHETTIVAATVPAMQEQLDPTDNPTERVDSYFHRVARALDTADEILVVGPSGTKLEFVKFMHKNDHAFDPRILGVETLDDLVDAKLAGYAKIYFTDGGPRRLGHGSGYKGTD